MGDICLRFYAGEWTSYRPLIQKHLDAGTLPFTKLWIVARYYDIPWLKQWADKMRAEGNLAAAEAAEAGINAPKHTVAETKKAISEAKSMGLAAVPNLALYPPHDWSVKQAWIDRGLFVETLLPAEELGLDIEGYAYADKISRPPFDGGNPLSRECDGTKFGQMLVAMSPFWYAVHKFPRVITYPSMRSYLYAATKGGVKEVADEPFDLCRQLCGLKPRTATRKQMVDFITRNRLNAEDEGAAYIPGVISSMYNPKYFHQLIEWFTINADAGVDIVNSDWFVFVDDRVNLLRW